MLINLDFEAPMPLYRQLRNGLEKAIANGKFGSERMPSSRELSEELGISRNTVNLAYQELIIEGYVNAHERSGLYVNAEIQQLLAKRLEHLTDQSLKQSVDWDARIQRNTSSNILGRINKPQNWHEYPYIFLGGQVNLSMFPTQAWMRALRTSLAEPHMLASLQDSQDLDDPMLVEQICSRILPWRGITAQPNEVLVTEGAQHALYLIAQALIQPGDVVGVEEPGYPDAFHIFDRAGAKLLGIPVDRHGMTLSNGLGRSSLVYLTPSHQFPTNVTLSIARRRGLLDTAHSSGAIIVEDDYDSEFRYQGNPTPSLKALDQHGRVIYIGSFSKFLAPGLRVGYIVGAPELIAQLRDRRRYMIRHVAGHLQRALAIMIESGEYQRSIRRNRRLLKKNWQVMVSACRELPGWYSDFPAGGTSVWLTGPSKVDSVALATAAQKEGILIEPGKTFFMNQGYEECHLRLGFSSIHHSHIREGVQRLRKVIGRQ